MVLVILVSIGLYFGVIYLILFVEGSVTKLLRNLSFENHSNGVLKSLTDQLNSHLKKTANQMQVSIHWWGTVEKSKYNSKLDFVKEL